MTLLDKKALATWKNKHNLHVLLVLDQEGCTKAVAEAQAYHEGVEGLAARQGHALEPVLGGSDDINPNPAKTK